MRAVLYVALGALHVDRARAFVRLLRFESDIVTFTKLVEVDAGERGRVEKQFFGLSFLGDEAESAIRQTLDCSCHN